MNNMGEYIDMMLKSKFPQSYLLSSNDFIRFTESIGLDLNTKDLEFYDKVGIIKPVLRLKRQKLRKTFPKYTMLSSDIFSLQDYYRNGFIELVKDDYQPWELYKDEDEEEEIILYYHPFQFLPLRRLTMNLDVRLKPAFFAKTKNLENLEESFESMKERVGRSLESSKKSYELFWIPRIGILILLDQAYGPGVKPFKVNINSDRNSYFKEWNEWRENEFQPNEILKISNLTIEEIKNWYEGIATEGEWMDPLSRWYVLQRIIKGSMKMRLKGSALYAQNCYRLAEMVYHFIYELTGEKMYEPDDIMDGNGHGQWKSRVYGSPFDYSTKRTQKRILATFLIDKPFRAGIIIEGDTEQEVIESILKALHIDKDRADFFLYNAKGQGNIVHNLKSLYQISKIEDIELFLIIDNDEDASQIQDQLKNFIKPENITVWNRDFEYDNFGVEVIVKELNSILTAKGLQPISRECVSEELQKSNKVLMNVISTINNRVNGVKLNNILSKTELASKLVRERSAEIQKERFEGDGWKPKLPIEIVLKNIFHKFPSISFS